MYYSININQIAIATFNKSKETVKLDLIDGCIMEYLQKQSTSRFAKKNFLITEDNEVFFLICYDNIIKQLPLLNIETKDAIGRRIKKLKQANIINHFIDRKNNNKIYFNTTDLFETFFSYDQTDEKPNPNGLQTERLTDEKPNHNIYDKNIKDKNINDKEKNIKKATILSEKETLFENFYKLYNNKTEITEQTKKTKGYNTLKEKFLKEVKTAKEEDILQGTRDYLSFIAFGHKRGSNRPLKDIQTFINQSAWEGNKGIPWNEVMQNTFNTHKPTQAQNKQNTQSKVNYDFDTRKDFEALFNN